MYSFYGLPEELFRHILALLSHQDQYQCMLVNNLWFAFASVDYFGHLTLTGKNMKYLEKVLFIDKNQDDTSIGRYGLLVRRLKIYNDNPRSLIRPHTTLGVVLSYFPFVSKIDLSHSQDCVPYLYNLMHIQDTTPFKYLNYIKVVNKDIICTIAGNRKIKDYYLNACYNFRESLTHLELLEPFSNSNVGNLRGVSYLDLLSRFKNLENLILYYNMENRQNAHLIYPSVLSTCPNLTFFKLACRIREAEGPIVHPSNFDNKNLVAHYPLSNANKLEKLYLTLPSLDQHQMTYITNNIRTVCLKKFVLTLDHWDTLKYWIPSGSLHRFHNFANYLTLAENLTIRVEQRPVGCSRKIMPLSRPDKLELVKIYLQMHRMFDLLRAFKGNRDYTYFKITGTIIVKRRDENFREISVIRSTIRNSAIELEQVIDSEFFCKKSNNILTAKFGRGIYFRNYLKKILILVWGDDFFNTLRFVLSKCLFPTHITFKVHRDCPENSAYLSIVFPRTFYPDDDPRRLSIIKMEHCLTHSSIFTCLGHYLSTASELTISNINREIQEKFTLNVEKFRYLKHLILEFEFSDRSAQVPPLRFILQIFSRDYNDEQICYTRHVNYTPPNTQANHCNKYQNDLVSLPVSTVLCSHIDTITILINGIHTIDVQFPPYQYRKRTFKEIVRRLIRSQRYNT